MMILTAWHRTKMDCVLDVPQGIYQLEVDVYTMMLTASAMIPIHLPAHVPSHHLHSAKALVCSNN